MNSIVPTVLTAAAMYGCWWMLQGILSAGEASTPSIVFTVVAALTFKIIHHRLNIRDEAEMIVSTMKRPT